MHVEIYMYAHTYVCMRDEVGMRIDMDIDIYLYACTYTYLYI